MRLYLDQMLKVDIAEVLRTKGHDVQRVSETGQSRADDAQILNQARKEERILITLDRHFGDWAILPLSHHPGVIRIRVHPPISRNILDILIPFLQLHNQEQFRDHLIILSRQKIRWIQTTV